MFEKIIPFCLGQFWENMHWFSWRTNPSWQLHFAYCGRHGLAAPMLQVCGSPSQVSSQGFGPHGSHFWLTGHGPEMPLPADAGIGSEFITETEIVKIKQTTFNESIIAVCSKISKIVKNFLRKKIENRWIFFKVYWF